MNARISITGTDILCEYDAGEPVRIAANAEATTARDGAEKALETLRNAAALFDEAGDVRERAVTMGQIADILQQRGETDEAPAFLCERAAAHR